MFVNINAYTNKIIYSLITNSNTRIKFKPLNNILKTHCWKLYKFKIFN